ncbi:MAG: endonuclease/exonuclease/phosphatase family protein [Alistipes sp.]|nr:endonuclease/exonuclease/phosphatase family protein [Alistipes sp.]
MSDDYYYDFSRRSGRERPSRSVAMLFVDFLMTLLTAVVAVVFVLTLVVPHVRPAYLGILPVLGLVAPWTYAVAVVLMLYWIVRWQWWRASAMIVLVAVGAADVSLYCKPQIRRSYGEPRYDRSAIRIMSYNVRGFYTDNGASFTVDSVAALVRRFNPDILCFQEFNVPHDYTLGGVDSLFGGYGNHVVVSRSDDSSPVTVAMFSRYRILRSETMELHSADSVRSSGKALWADLLVDKDTVRVFDVHLNSTSINSADNDYIMNHRYMSDTARHSKLWNIVHRLNANTVSRSIDVDSIAAARRSSPAATVVCGDFNDTPMSYAYRALAEGMKDAFRECGSGYSYTFRGFYNSLRIDFVLLDEERFDVVSYAAPDSVRWSDHLPVFVRAKLKN